MQVSTTVGDRHSNGKLLVTTHNQTRCLEGLLDVECNSEDVLVGDLLLLSLAPDDVKVEALGVYHVDLFPPSARDVIALLAPRICATHSNVWNLVLWVVKSDVHHGS